MCLLERQCIFGSDNVSSGDTMYLPETQCIFQKHNVSSVGTMCLPETQCVFWRDNVSAGETIPDIQNLQFFVECRGLYKTAKFVEAVRVNKSYKHL